MEHDTSMLVRALRGTVRWSRVCLLGFTRFLNFVDANACERFDELSGFRLNVESSEK